MVHNNYYSCYYNNDPSQLLRASIDDKWKAHFTNVPPIIEPIGTFKQTVLHNCELIYDQFRKYTPTINLFFSGGTDSECMLKCFTELKIPVKPIVIVHKHYSNSDETILAKHVCKELSLTPTIIDLDLYKLYDSGIGHELGIKYQAVRASMIELLYGLTKLNEPAIIVDDIVLNYTSGPRGIVHPNETENQQWFYELLEGVDGLFDRYEHLTGIPIAADPYKYTPTSWAAMIKTADISNIVLNKMGKTSSASTKNIVMSKTFNVPYRIKTEVFRDGLQKHIVNKFMKDLKNHIPTPKTYPIEYFELLKLLGSE